MDTDPASINTVLEDIVVEVEPPKKSKVESMVDLDESDPEQDSESDGELDQEEKKLEEVEIAEIEKEEEEILKVDEDDIDVDFKQVVNKILKKEAESIWK